MPALRKVRGVHTPRLTQRGLRRTIRPVTPPARNARCAFARAAFFVAMGVVGCGGEIGLDDGAGGDGAVDGVGDGSAGDAIAVGDGARDVPDLDAALACAVGGVRGVCLPVTMCTGDRAPTPGFCPGPVDVQCCTTRRADASMDAPTDARADAGGDAAADGPPTDGGRCDPMAMPLPNRDFTEAPGDVGCPNGMARIGTFCVDRYEAMLALVNTDGTLSPWSPYFNPGTRRMRAFSIRGVVPQGYINGVQAQAACRDAGKRLCLDAEWLRACRGPSNTVYPYGGTRMPGVCNDARSMHPAVEYFGTTASWIYSMIDNACLNQLPASLARSGDRTGCVTVEGAFDMMGNLHEWTAEPAGTFRGGFYVDTRINGDGCLYATTAHDTSHSDYSTGFRCCADAR